ncbi:MAG TPA: bifunctional YncE family protein/alkaline phosphatase family protein [Candidatus Tumulicola sp.]|nr:bifunctional YncE family protein/alkaline phosphatase family protein [Candidatus Tumulicola sp.]
MTVRTQCLNASRYAAGLAAAIALFSASAPPRAADVTVLPNGWRVTPAGSLSPLGTLPLHMAQDATGRWLAITNAGFSKQSVVVVDEGNGRVTDSRPIERTFFGVAFSPDGRALYVSSGGDGGVLRYPFDPGSGKLSDPAVWPVGVGKLFAGGIAVSSNGKSLYTAVEGADLLVGVDTSTGTNFLAAKVGVHPLDVALSQNGARVYVSNWGGESVSVVDIAKGATTATIPVSPHPNALLLSVDGRTLYAACADDNSVALIDTQTNRVRSTIDAALYPFSPAGAAPNGLSQSLDGRTLYVADAGANAVVAIDVSSAAPRVFGAVPAGWYPTDVELSHDGRRLYILDGMGVSGHANPQNAHNDLTSTSTGHSTTDPNYIGVLSTGALQTVAVPDRAALISGLASARANALYRPDATTTRAGLPPIKHVIYVIRENRTYDEVLGDDSRGNGDANLAAFGRRVTPNIHRLAADFALLDNFYVEGQVSADGHQWSDAAYVSDYVAKLWPSAYSHRGWDFSLAPAEMPSSGFIWEDAARHGQSVRVYGEFTAFDSPPGAARAGVPSLEGILDTHYRGFDTAYSDQDRIHEWLREFHGYEATESLPALEVVSLPNDHTAALKPGYHTPNAMVADNDYALARMIEALSNSAYWRDTVVFSVEDDAQDGPDHVSDQRSVALVAGAYVRRGIVDHTQYTSSSVLRTVELLLGLPPMTQFDAAATPMTALFAATPDMRPWAAVAPSINLNGVNPTGAAASASMRLDLSRPDANDPAEFRKALNARLNHSPSK